MAGGPLFPHSISFLKGTGRAFPNMHEGGTNTRHIEGIGIEASLSADTIVELAFQLPKAFPTGTAKLLLREISDVGATQAAKVNPKWGLATHGENPDTITLTAEGTSTVSLTSAENDELFDTEITLDANSLTGAEGEELIMDLTFETTGWTLAVVSTWVASIIWE